MFTQLLIFFLFLLINQAIAGGLDNQINTTWNGQPIGKHEPVKFHMEYQNNTNGPVIQINFTAPYFNDTKPNCSIGFCADLYNYEVVEFFFANDTNQYLGKI